MPTFQHPANPANQDKEPKPEPMDGLMPMDFLTPQQRAEAIAEILSTIALRIMRQQHDEGHKHDQEDQDSGTL